MDALNLISVAETATRELIATGARLIVCISGQSFITGTQAFKKAAEVAECISSLKECGVSDDDIRLLNVSAEVDSGFLIKSSSATYQLEIKCRSMESLAPIIGAISSQKNSEISSVAWDYFDLAKTKKDVLQDAVRATSMAATAIADALNVSVLGVHRLSYEVNGLDTDLSVPGRRHLGGRAVMEFKKGVVGLPSGLTFSHATRIAVTVKADFLVAALSEGK